MKVSWNILEFLFANLLQACQYKALTEDKNDRKVKIAINCLDFKKKMGYNVTYIAKFYRFWP